MISIFPIYSKKTNTFVQNLFFIKMSLLGNFMLFCSLFISSLANAQTDSLRINNDTLSTKKDTSQSSSIVTSDTSKADTTKKVARPQVNEFKVGCVFLKNSIEFNKNEIISNVLWIVNENSSDLTVSLLISAPEDWQTLGSKRTYTLPANGELYIPIRIIPRIGTQGSGNFFIWTNIQNKDSIIIGSSSFNASLFKISNWNVSVSKKKYYLKNDEYSTIIDVAVSNNGNFTQDLILSALPNKKDIILLDSASATPFKTKNISISPNQDTTFRVRFIKNIHVRNQHFIDLENYNPIHLGEAQKSQILWKAQSPYPKEKNIGASFNSTEIVKLSDEVNIQPLHSAYIPLIMNINVFNIIGGQPMMSVLLNGASQIDEKQYVYYTFQTFFTRNYLTVDAQNIQWLLGYRNDKVLFQIGNGGGYVFGAYAGSFSVRGEYYFNTRRKVGVLYSQLPNLFLPTQYYTGSAYYNEYSKKYTVNIQYAHSTRTLDNNFIDIIDAQGQWRGIKNHTFGIRLFGSRKVIQPDTVKLGYGGALNYSAKLLNNKLTLTLNNMYTQKDFGIFNSERFFNNLQAAYSLPNKHRLLYFSNYNRIQFSTLNFSNEQWGNEIRYQFNSEKLGYLYPAIFYNLYNIQNFTVHSRGAGFGLSKFEFEKNLRYFFSLRMGYNYSPDTLKKNFFFTMFNSQVYYKTFSANFRYLMGNLAMSENIYLINQYITPQMINISLRHQYQFKIKSFVMDNMASYIWSNYTTQSFFIQPSIYYFTKSGWRFSANIQFNWTKNYNPLLFIFNPYFVGTNQNTDSRKWTYNTLINFGVRKEFQLPIPYKKRIFSMVDIYAFYDLNGDGIKQNNEQALENVVIQIDDHEVITNSKGMARIRNLEMKSYTWNIFSLEETDNWFPNVSDTISIQQVHQIVYIPFTHGIKVIGKVFLHKDPKAVNYYKIDLSRIKITAANHKVYHTLTDNEGNFQIFLPTGKYTITMDESILGNGFKILKNNYEIKIDEKFANIFIPFEIIQIPKKVKTIRFDSQGNPINEQ